VTASVTHTVGAPIKTCNPLPILWPCSAAAWRTCRGGCPL